MRGREVSRLLGRPAIRPGMSLAGYCWILDAANLEFGGGRLAQALHLDIDRLNRSAAVLEALARATGRPAEAIAEATLATMAGGLPGRTKTFFCGRQIDPLHLLEEGMRICPSCLAEGHPHQAEWDLLATVCCRRHAAWLIDRCPGCGESLRHSRSRQSFCDCGRPIAKMSAAPAPQVVAEAMRWALSTLPFGDGSLPAGWPPPLPLDGALVLLERLGGCFREESRLPREDLAASPDLRETRERVCDSAELLGNWPTAFAEVVERQAARDSRYNDFSRAMTLAYTLLFQSPWADDLGDLQRIVDRVLHRLSEGRLHPWGPLVPPVEAAAREGALLEPRDARFILKLEPTELNQIIADGLLDVLPHPREHPTRPYLVRKVELDSLLARLAAGPTDRSRPAMQAVAFKGAQRIVHTIGGSLGHLVRILLAREVHPVRRDPDQQGLAQYAVDFDDLLEYVLHPARWLPAPTLADLQSLLQLPGTAARALLDVLTDGGRSTGVDAHRLRAFVTDHVFPARVAFALGVPKSAIAAALAARGARIVRIGGTALTLYRRSDLAGLLDSFPRERRPS